MSEYSNGTDVREQIFKNYGFNGSADIITSELKARKSPYADPLTLNFKLIINWNKPYGLFADKSNTNSALAYLERIGETNRVQMLELFILKFKEFIKDYDFLILNCEGLAEIINAKPYECFKEGEDKVSFTCRETIDMRIQGLLTLYREIWYDNSRSVEVLPANLRRFDCYVLVYTAGYFNMLLYDISQNESYEKALKTNPDKVIFPTLKKLSQLNENDLGNIPFNHILVYLGDASIFNEESGKNFFSELSNEMSSDYIKNNIVLTYRFAKYSGIFHNVTGSVNYGMVLSMIAEVSKSNNKDKFKNYFKNLGDAFVNAGKDTWNNIKNDIKNDTITAAKGIISKATPIGNALDYFADPNKIVGSVSNAINAGIEQLEQKYVYGNITKLQNMVSGNFSENMLTDMVLGLTKSKPKGITNEPIPQDTAKVNTNMEQLPSPPVRDFSSGETYVPEKIGKVMKGIKYGTGNVYDRKTF